METDLKKLPDCLPRTGSGRLAKCRVLVVDDNQDLAISTSWLLEREGHEVQVSFDGLDALEVARSFRPDVVLLDVGLPGVDGYELARRLRAEFGLQMLLIIVSAYIHDDRGNEGQEASVDYHFTKPVDLRALTCLLA